MNTIAGVILESTGIELGARVDMDIIGTLNKSTYEILDFLIVGCSSASPKIVAIRASERQRHIIVAYGKANIQLAKGDKSANYVLTISDRLLIPENTQCSMELEINTLVFTFTCSQEYSFLCKILNWQ